MYSIINNYIDLLRVCMYELSLAATLEWWSLLSLTLYCTSML
jgi:hypothetical protein